MDTAKRIGGFRWSFIPRSWWDPVGLVAEIESLVSIWWLILTALWLVEFILVRPTVGVVRLAINHSRSPGWRLRVMYTQVVRNGIGDYTVDFQTRKKRQAKRLRRTLRRELRRAGNLDFNAPDVQAAVAANHATAVVVSNSSTQPPTQAEP